MSLSSSLSTASSAGSAFEPEDSEGPSSPSPQTVSASLDEYVCASKVGRAAFASGDLKTAVEQFDAALKIELQTEMDCLYDTSLGFVSGLVRQEVESRLVGSPKHSEGPPSCEDVLGKLANTYSEAEKQLTLKPTVAKWYLQMGTCLCIADAWEQARKIYQEGLNLCKDPRERKELGRALKNLSKIEHVTSGDNQPEPYEIGLYAPLKPKPVATPKRKPKRHFSISLSPRRKSRPKSEFVEPPDVDEDLPDHPVPRHTSFSHELRLTDRERTMSDPPPPPTPFIEEKTPKRKKRFGLSLKRKRHSEPDAVQPQLSIDYEERQAWLEMFGKDSPIASGCQGFCPSAIIHMRRLSLESLSPASHRPVTVKSLPAYSAREFHSLKIEGDDSEIEDF